MGNYIGIEKFIFIDVYNLLLKYIEFNSLSDEQWCSLVNEVRELSHKYDNHPMARHMALEVIYEMELKCGKCRTDEGKKYSDYKETLNRVLSERYKNNERVTTNKPIVKSPTKDMSKEDKVGYWFGKQ